MYRSRVRTTSDRVRRALRRQWQRLGPNWVNTCGSYFVVCPWQSRDYSRWMRSPDE